jgi:hypothetical protein
MWMAEAVALYEAKPSCVKGEACEELRGCAVLAEIWHCFVDGRQGAENAWSGYNSK